MRVAILSESPTLATGFARTTRTLAASLLSAGHEVVCYGIGLFGETFDRHAYPYRIWAAGMLSDDLVSRFRVFAATEKPDIIIINYDLISVLVWLRYITTIGLSSNVICHLVIDGMPVDSVFLEPLSSCRGLVVPSARVAEYITPQVDCPVYHFPHLVDLSDFYPASPSPIRSRSECIIGCIAQNRGRKQLQQLLLAVQQLRAEGFPCLLRLHTDRINASRHGGDNLRRIVRALELEAAVIATEYGECPDTSSDVVPSVFIADIIRSCDCMIVAPTCGGFEYGVIEAQACGVPVLVTKDGGILEEVSGGAAHFLVPALFDYTSYGAHAFRIAPSEIVKGIKTIWQDSSLRASLSRAGEVNARRYTLLERQHEFAEMVGEMLQ